jgi:hypothetical protein
MTQIEARQHVELEERVWIVLQVGIFFSNERTFLCLVKIVSYKPTHLEGKKTVGTYKTLFPTWQTLSVWNLALKSSDV